MRNFNGMTLSIKKYSIVLLVGLGACSGASELNPDPSVIVEDTIITEPVVEDNTEVETPQASDILVDEVMEIHDEVMPKIETINRYMTELEVLKDEDAQASYVYEELDNADKAMMSWMRSVKVNKEGTEEERIAYYETEKIKIENVKTMMLNSIELAKAYLGDEK